MGTVLVTRVAGPAGGGATVRIEAASALGDALRALEELASRAGGAGGGEATTILTIGVTGLADPIGVSILLRVTGSCAGLVGLEDLARHTASAGGVHGACSRRVAFHTVRVTRVASVALESICVVV